MGIALLAVGIYLMVYVVGWQFLHPDVTEARATLTLWKEIAGMLLAFAGSGVLLTKGRLNHGGYGK